MESEADVCRALFSCTRCGDCCKGYGGTYLTRRDIEEIADYLGLSPEHVVARYTHLSGERRLIAQAENGYCIFWNQVCTIHPVKPRMCRQWPYIRSVLVDVGNWRAMAASCPGMDADASEQQILACVKAKLAAENPHER